MKIGYIGQTVVDPASDETQLRSAGCALIRRETAGARDLIVCLGFLQRGEMLVVPSIVHLKRMPLAQLLARLDESGVQLQLLSEDLMSSGDEGRHLRLAAAAVAELTGALQTARPGARTRSNAIRLRAEGRGPSDIARELGVSRMTVWRWLKVSNVAA